MIEEYSKFDFFNNEIIYVNDEAQAIYIEIIEKGQQFFLESKHSNIYQDTISELFEKIRGYHKYETKGYSIFSRIEVKTTFFEKMIDYKISNFINHSVSKQNEYKKYLLDALKLMHTIALFKKSNSKDVFKNIKDKYYFLAFTRPMFLQEIYEGLINEVDYFIGKLSELGLSIQIDFENGFMSTNGLKYSYLKENQVSVDFQYKNPYPRIFKNKTCFVLFIWLKENLVKDEYADYSFIYYEMIKRGFIYSVKHIEFIEFLSKIDVTINYNKLKTNKSTKNKTDRFIEGIDLIKPNSTIF
jgi:hypothetical protein